MSNLFSNKPLLITIVAILVLGLLAFFTSGDRTLSFVESTLGSIFQPVQQFSYNISGEIADFFGRIFMSRDIDKENAELRAQIEQLKQKLLDYDKTKSENESLRKLLDYSSTFSDGEFVAAQVIGKGTSAWFDIITVNAGRNKGIETGMCVMTSDGLVGRVTNVGATWCKVSAIIDGSVSVSGMNNRTRDVGIIKGLVEADTATPRLGLSYLPAGFDLVPGDIISTSGLGADLPRGIPIGIVTEVMQADQDADKINAIIEPYVDFLHLEDVLILTSPVTGG